MIYFSADKNENLIESGKKLLNSLSIDGIKTLKTSERKSIETKRIYGKSFQNGTPTPTSPIEIQSVVNPKIEVCGKNLLKPTLQTATNQGVTCTNNDDGTYTFNGTSISPFNFVLCNLKLPKGTYKFVGSPQNDSYYQTYVTNNTLSENYIGDMGNGYEFTITQTCNLTFYLWGAGNYTFNNIVFKPMITTDLNATYNDFEPYKGQTETLPYTLNAIPVSSGGNVTIDGQEYIADYVDIENKKLVRMTKYTKLFDFSIVWGNSQAYPGSTYCNIKDLNESILSLDSFIISDKLVYDGSFSETKYSYGKIEYDGSLNFFIKDGAFVDDNERNNILKEINIIYPLATPTITDLTDEEVEAFKNLRTYEGVTNIIVSSDDLVPKVEMDMYDYNYGDYVINPSNNGFRIAKNGVDLGQVKPKTSYLSIEGADGKIDVTQALTKDIKYENRTPSIKYIDCDLKSMDNILKSNELNNIFNGEIRKMYIDDWYLEGRFTLKNSLSVPIGTYQIDGDCFPYRLNAYKDIKEYNVNNSLDCVIDYVDKMRVCPNINVSNDMSLVIGDNTYSLKEGNNIVPDFILEYGKNNFKITGTGLVRISWRGGNL